VLVGNHSETSALSPYEGLREALAPATAGLRLERLKDAVDPLWLQQASSVLDGLSSLVGSGVRPRLRPAEEPWRTTEALARVILAQGRPKPTVLILEDIHNCDEDTVAVLTQLGDRLIDSQVLVCLTYRLRAARAKEPIWEALSQLEAEPGSSRLVVPPLQPEEVRELVGAELGPGRMSTGMMDQLIRSTTGNPYMLLELLRSPLDLLANAAPADWADGMSDDSEIGGSDVTYRRIEDELLPKLSALIGQRIEAVPDHVRLILEAMAAIGAPASADVVARAAGIDRSSAVDGLQRAMDLGFLVETERGCEFDQTQTRRVVYETMAIERRSALHGRVVDALTLVDQRASVGQLAHHAWLAGQWRRAHQYHSLAADAAVGVNAYQTAAEHFNKADHAARSAGIADEDRVEDLLEHEAVLDVLGRRTNQHELLDRVELIEDLPVSLGVRLQHRRASLLLQTEGAADAVEVAEAAAQEARANGINAGELLTTVGTALYRTGKLTASLGPLEDAVAELRAGGLSAVQAQLMLGRASADLHRFDDAHRFLEEAYNEAKAADDPRSQVEALGHMAILWDIQSVVSRVEQAFTEAIGLAKEIGFRQGEGYNTMNLAVFYTVRGRGGLALALLDEATKIFSSLQDRRAEAYGKVNRAWVLHWFIGDDLAAERDATDAAMQFREIGDLRAEAVCLNVIAGGERRSGRRRRAKQRLTYAIDQAIKAEDRRTEVQVHLNLALVDMDLGHRDEALDRLAIARELSRSYDLVDFTAVLAAVEALVRSELGQLGEAAELTETTIRNNHRGAELAHLAAWWCARALMACDQLEAASEQVALAHELLTHTLEGLPETTRQRAWTDVPEHRQILEARERYFLDRIVCEVPAQSAPTGRSLGGDDFVSVTLTRSDPNDWLVEDSIERRRLRLQRIAVEALDQGGVARQADLAAVLEVSERTVKRDLAELRAEGVEVVTRRTAE
jgi:tetratricopeptide (TPR) repeat protein